MSLPPLNSVKVCPKCGEDFGKSRVSGWPEMEYHIVGREKECGDPQSLAEHQCRTCLYCGCRWPEAVYADPEPGLPE